jgi:hypothetical protein
LKANEYLIETDNGLKWRKTKQSLAEYFGNLPLSRETKRNNVPWKAIEILFGVKDLKIVSVIMEMLMEKPNLRIIKDY